MKMPRILLNAIKRTVLADFFVDLANALRGQMPIGERLDKGKPSWFFTEQNFARKKKIHLGAATRLEKALVRLAVCYAGQSNYIVTDLGHTGHGYDSKTIEKMLSDMAAAQRKSQVALTIARILVAERVWAKPTDKEILFNDRFQPIMAA